VSFADYIIAIPIQRSILITKFRILQFPSSPLLVPAHLRFRIQFITKRILNRLATPEKAQRRAQKKNVSHTQSVTSKCEGDKFFPKKKPPGEPSGF